MSFKTHYDDDGFATIELVDVEPVSTFTQEFIDSGVFVSRHRNTITVHAINGDFTYRLTGFHSRGIYRGELIPG